MSEIIIYYTYDGKANIKFHADNNTVWLTQNQIAELFDTTKQNISLHLNKCFKEKELIKDSVVKYYLTTASDGKKYNTAFYNLEAILAVGFRVRSIRGVQFRQWANSTLKEFLEKGFILDDDRLKNPDGRPDFFDELLDRIRDIRASEKRFYQKLRDLFALSTDYVSSDTTTQLFFAETQNKLIYGVTQKTASELIISRADSSKPNMALTSWKGNIVRKQDIYIAKNYLTIDEIDLLNRLVVLFLESAELRVKQRKTLTLDYWKNSVDKLLMDHDIPLLVNTGKISNEEMKKHVEEVYFEFDTNRKKLDAHKADLDELKELEASAYSIKFNKR